MNWYYENLMSNFTNAKSEWNINILKAVQIATRLEELNVPLVDDFLVHHVLNYLPMKFEQLKIFFLMFGEKNGE